MVRHLLVTHPHPDHADPEEIAELARRAQARDESLTLYGGADAIGNVREAIDASLPLSLTALRPFEPEPVGRWEVTPLPARHMDGHPEAFLYVLSEAGCTMLYACDTGPLFDAVVEHLKGMSLDAVVMEATFGLQDESTGIPDLRSNHLNLPLAVAERQRLLAQDTIGPDTPWYATHVSLHHCPPHEESVTMLRERGIVLAWDGLAWAL